MSLDQETIDRITLLAASEILDNAPEHMERWKQERASRHLTGPATGTAPAGGLGGDLFAFIQGIVTAAWDWCVANKASLVADAAEAVGDQVKDWLVKKVLEMLRLKNDKDHAALSEEEITLLAQALAPLIAQELIKRGVLPVAKE